MGTHYHGTTEEIQALNTYIKLMRAANTIQMRLEQRLTAFHLTENQFGTLEMLYHLGTTHQYVLGRKLFTSKGNITVLIDQLEKRSLVTRERDTKDRRLVGVQLTKLGVELVKSLLPDHVAAIVQLMASLTLVEQKNLASLCKKLGLGASGQ
jgi:MarR family transcriptional regulator, 2-MHQ and catechol-resistance regulon repressor